jgi:type IV pilus secretin PilQ/predicted competence protein
LRLLAALAALSLSLARVALAAPDLGKLISLDADDAYLPAVLKLLAEKGDLNIVTGPGVTAGKVTIHLKDVPVEQAVNLVVRAAGLAYERIGNSILVADAEALSGETGLSSYTIPLKYADATEAAVALSGLSDKIQVDRGGNRLIVVTSPRVISEIQEIVEKLDQPAQQVMLEARIVEVNTDDLKELGIDWALLNRQGFTFIEENPDATYEGDPESPGQITAEDLISNTPGTMDIWKLKNFSRLPKTFRVFLDMLIQQGNARVMAQPKLVTLNGKPASMLAGQRVPYLTSQTVFAGGAAAPTETVQMEEVGIKLSITPLINADGYITVQVRPEVSTIVGFRGADNSLPVVATRQAETTVRLKDGASVIIGGLLSEEMTKTTVKLPLLGDVPVMGWLFRHESVQANRRDLVIEVTPRLIPEPKLP